MNHVIDTLMLLSAIFVLAGVCTTLLCDIFDYPKGHQCSGAYCSRCQGKR